MTAASRLLARAWVVRAWVLLAAAAMVVLLAPTAGAAAPADLRIATDPGGSVVTAAAADLRATVADASTQNLSALGACLISHKSGDVVVMLDDSGSIGASDRAGARIDAAKNLMDRLSSRLADPASALHGVTLSVAVASFGEAVRQDGTNVEPGAAKWGQLDQAHLTALQADIETYRPRLNGKETDYWTALNWIIGAESAHNGNKLSAGCHLVLWFTDGQYAIAARNDKHNDWTGISSIKVTPWTESGTSDATTPEEAKAIQIGGTNDICRVGGLADQMRSDNLTVATIGLSKDDNSDQTNFDLLKQIAVNPAGDCGKLAGTGVFQTVHAGTLALAFDALGDTDGTLLPVDSTKVCERQACDQYAHKFVLDSSLRRVHIAGAVTVAGLLVVIRGPSAGKAVEIAPVAKGQVGQISKGLQGDVEVDYQWLSDKQLTVDMTRPSNAKSWNGTWTVTFIDTTGTNSDALTSTQIILSADLALNAGPKAATSIHAADTYTLPLALTSQSGDAPDIGDPAPQMAYVVTATPTGGGPLVTVGHGSVSGTAASPLSWAVPAGFAVGKATVSITLTVSSKSVPAGELSPVQRQFQLDVLAPVGVGSVTTAAVDFGTVEGVKTADSSIPVIGPGCFWVADGAITTGPESVKSVAIGSRQSSEAACLTLTDGQHGSLDVTATPSDPGNGLVRGQLAVHFEPIGRPERAGQKVVLYDLTVQRQIKSSVFWVVLLGTILIGLGLPLAVLWFTRRSAARYPRTISWSAANVPVRVGPRTVRTAGGAELVLPQEWASVPPAGPGRRSIIAAGVRLRARTGPLWSSAAGYTETEDRPGVGTGSPHFSTRKLTARMPLSVQGSWAILFQERAPLAGSSEELSAELLLVAHASADSDARRALLREAVQDGPGFVADLRDAARKLAGTAAASSGPGEAGNPPGGSGTSPVPDDLPDGRTPTGWPPAEPAGWPSGGTGSPASSSWPSSPDQPTSWPGSP